MTKGKHQISHSYFSNKYKKDSWYWNVLIKNTGSVKEAEKAIKKSKAIGSF